MYTIYSTTTCSYCKRAKEFLTERGEKYNEIIITSQEILDGLATKLGYIPKTVPQIWRGKTHVGGYDDLVRQYNETEAA